MIKIFLASNIPIEVYREEGQIYEEVYDYNRIKFVWSDSYQHLITHTNKSDTRIETTLGIVENRRAK